MFNFVLLFNWSADQVHWIFRILCVHLKSLMSSLSLEGSRHSACVVFQFTCICLLIYVLKSVRVNKHLLRSKKNFQEWILSFHRVDPKNGIRVVKHSGVSFTATPSSQPSDQLTNDTVTFYGLWGITVFKGWGYILSPMAIFYDTHV